MSLSRGTRSKRTRAVAGGLLGLRREIDARVVNMILDQLTDHQRELLASTAGNPMIAARLERLVESLLCAERVLAKAGARAPSLDEGILLYLPKTPSSVQTKGDERPKPDDHERETLPDLPEK